MESATCRSKKIC